MGPLVKPDRLYRIIVTILVESSALYAVSFVLTRARTPVASA